MWLCGGVHRVARACALAAALLAGCVLTAAVAYRVVYEENFDNLSTFLHNEPPLLYAEAHMGRDGTGGLLANNVPTDRGSDRLQFVEPLPPARAYTLEYDVYFHPNFEWVHGGKLPGFRGGHHKTTGCVQPQPPDSFSLRVMWQEEGRLSLYAYDQSRNDPDAHHCGVSTRNDHLFLEKNVWHTITVVMKLESVAGVRDGYASLWVGDDLWARRDGIAWRGAGADDVLIDNFFFSHFYGGHNATYAPTKPTYVRFDNFRVHAWH